MAVQVLMTLISYLIMTGSVNQAFGMVYSVGLIYMLPMFTLWAVVGLLIRRLSRRFRMLVNLAISTSVIAGITLYFAAAEGSSASPVAMATFYYLAGLLWLSSITGGLVTYLYLVAPPRPKKK